MNWFKNRKTVTKLMIGFGSMAVLIGFVGYRGMTAASQINAMLNTMYERDLAGLSAVKEANINLIYISRAVRAALLSDDKAETEQHAQNVERYATALLSNLEKAEKTLVTDEAKATMAKTRAAVGEYLPQAREAMRLARAGEDKKALEVVKAARQVANRVDEDMSALAESKEKLGKKAYEDSDVEYANSRSLMLAIIFGAVVLAAGLGIFLARLVAAPLVRTVDVLNEVAKGDLTQSLDIATQDEVGQMASALNRAVGSMRETMRQVSAAADNVAMAAQQLASSSEELSSGAQEQAASQEETSATTEEISSTIKRNAENARQANQLAAGARTTAEAGGEVVNAAVGAMGEINAASKRIADIITTIDEIAFQTNLLALNAAVEAARAGEQGRGFAVVASEVRNLAQRSAASAKEIKGLIQDSVRKVENGSELVNRSGKTLTEIVTSVKRVTDIVAEISAASQEQATGIDQVGKAMAQMDQVTQQNSSQTEELSSTSQALASQAEQLQALVAQFTVDDRQSSRPAPGRTQTTAPVRPTPKKASQHGPAQRTGTALGQLAKHVNQEPAPQAANFVEY